MKRSQIVILAKVDIAYRMIPKPVYIIPSQGMSPSVNVSVIGKDVHLSVLEYQWPCDSI